MHHDSAPGTFEALDRMDMMIDVRDVLLVVSAPTLVVNQHANPWVRPEHGRYLAEHIPGRHKWNWTAMKHSDSCYCAAVAGTYGSLPTRGGHPGGSRAGQGAGNRPVSDIVGSTAQAAELGDAHWRQLLAEHHTRVRRQSARYRGVEPDTAGDGFCRFDGADPRNPLRAGDPETVREIGLEVRLGLHAGEFGALDATVAGIAVAIGARMAIRVTISAAVHSSQPHPGAARLRPAFRARPDL
jgi:hypothetical protein